MAVGWFLCPYKRRVSSSPFYSRYCAIDDLTLDIMAEGGDWSETEVLGDTALVKVRASAALLATIAGTTGFHRLPKVALSDPLSDLTAPQLAFLNTRLLALGYSQAEVDAASATDWRGRTFGDLLRLVTTRRLKPHWDGVTLTFSGIAPVRPVQSVDEAVPA